jgi:hypothetical protein
VAIPGYQIEVKHMVLPKVRSGEALTEGLTEWEFLELRSC